MINKLEINNIKVNYSDSGEGLPLVLMHGWGCDHTIFAKAQEYLSQFFRVISFDFPGFGKTDEPQSPWDIFQYASFTQSLLQKQDVKNPILIGHSFGGRVALILGGRINVHKIILTGGAGIKPKRSLKYYFKVYSFKLLKKLLYLPGLRNKREEILEKRRKKAGSADYRSASPVMRQVLVKVVNQDLKYLMPLIKASVLLLWGEFDTATPLKDAKIMEQLIPDAGLAVLKGGTHYAFIEKHNEFIAIVDNFLDKDKK